MMSTPIGNILKQLWWLVLLRGILLILLGVLALIQPLQTALIIVLLFGFYAVLDGLLWTWFAIRSRKQDAAWGWALGQGLITLAAGVVTLIWPLTAGVVGILYVLWFITISLIAGGLMNLAAALRGRERGRGWEIAAGTLTVLFGVLLAVVVLSNPEAAALALIWSIGIYALLAGAVLVVQSLQFRRGNITAVARLEDELGTPIS